MSHVQLYRIEAGVTTDSGSGGKLVDHLSHIALVHRPLQKISTQQPRLVNAGRSTDGAPLDLDGGDKGAAMGQLHGDLATLGVNRISQHLEIGNDLFTQPNLVGQSTPALGHGTISHGGQRNPASRHVAVMLDHGPGWRAVQAHCLIGTGPDEPVAQCNRPQLEGCERLLLMIGHERLLLNATWARGAFPARARR